MKAREVGYERARTLGEALDLLARLGPEARVIAGGQSLVPAMNLRLAAPSHLVDIGGLDELRGIRVLRGEGRGTGGGRLRIGALARHVDVLRSADVARCAPLLAKAVHHVAHAAIRNRGTFGGSIAHADPASEFAACALALDAGIEIAGRGGRRIVAARDFFLGLHETAVRPGEILSAVEVDAVGEGWRAGFAELSRRAGDYAMVGLAAMARPRPGRMLFDEASIAFFSVADRPVLAGRAMAALTDAGIPDADRLRRASAALAADLDPPATPDTSAATRLHLARVLLGRVCAELAPVETGTAGTREARVA